MISVNLRLPDELHASLSAEVARRKRLYPGASLNSLIIEALVAYVRQLQHTTNASDE